MEITDVKIRRTFEEGPMKAVVSVTFGNVLVVHDIKLVYARDSFFVVMPSKKLPDGRFQDIVHPIDNRMRAALEKSVIDAYHVYLIANNGDE